jgi:ribose-phosphate pyrophosphokinase
MTFTNFTTDNKFLIKDYPDGFSYVELTLADYDIPSTGSLIIEVFWKINSYRDLFLLKSLKDVLHYTFNCPIHLTIPCFPQQQHDRRSINNSTSFEIRVVTDFINQCNFNRVTIFHPHSDVTPALIDNCRVISNKDLFVKCLDDIKNAHNISANDIIVLTPDAGSYKATSKLVEDFNLTQVEENSNVSLVSASKYRDAVTHQLTQVLPDFNFTNKSVLIVDDLCVYGGTFVGLAKKIREQCNVSKLFLMVSHMTVPNPNPDLDHYFDHIYCTNSKYDQYKLSNLKVLSLTKNLTIA